MLIFYNFLIKENKLKSTPYQKAKHKIEPKKWSENRITACWIGHAAVLIKINGLYIITDPVLLKRLGPPEFMGNIFILILV